MFQQNCIKIHSILNVKIRKVVRYRIMELERKLAMNDHVLVKRGYVAVVR
jgi:hypothetical protein